VTGFHLEATLSTYSGGTVRDFHPIILLSEYDRTPYPPRNWYQVVLVIIPPDWQNVNTPNPAISSGSTKTVQTSKGTDSTSFRASQSPGKSLPDADRQRRRFQCP
jgi:hypothetical protein